MSFKYKLARKKGTVFLCEGDKLFPIGFVDELCAYYDSKDEKLNGTLNISFDSGSLQTLRGFSKNDLDNKYKIFEVIEGSIIEATLDKTYTKDVGGKPKEVTESQKVKIKNIKRKFPEKDHLLQLKTTYHDETEFKTLEEFEFEAEMEVLPKIETPPLRDTF